MGNIKRIIPFICLIFLACPPPGYKLKFKNDGLLLDKIVISEGKHHMEISGFHAPLAAGRDRVWLEGRYGEADTLDKKACERIVQVQTNFFTEDDILSYGDGSCVHDLRHEWIPKISPEEYYAMLDTIYLKITINDFVEKPMIFDVVFNKDWIKKRYGLKTSDNKKKD
jgi:hypothetical protein